MKKAERMSDAEIMAIIRSGRDMDASIRELYRVHFEVLSVYVVQNNGSTADAEDIFQEVLIAFINLVQAGKFRGEATIRTFLYALNRNIWLNELKKRGRTEAREIKYNDANRGMDNSIDLVLEQRESEGLLQRTMQLLGDNCRRILLMFYFENRSMKEILSTLHYENEQVVRNKKYKCLKKMEQLVKDDQTLFHQLKNYLHG